MSCTASNYWLHKPDCNGLKAPNHTEPRWDATLSSDLSKGMQERARRQSRWVIQGSIRIRTSPINSNHELAAIMCCHFNMVLSENRKRNHWSIIIFWHFTLWTAPLFWYPPFSDPNCLDCLPTRNHQPIRTCPLEGLQGTSRQNSAGVWVRVRENWIRST